MVVKYGVWKLQIFETISHKLYKENIQCKEHYKYIDEVDAETGRFPLASRLSSIC